MTVHLSESFARLSLVQNDVKEVWQAVEKILE